MLAGLVGLFVAAGLLLRGAWDLWAQSAAMLVLLCGTASWFFRGVATGYLPRPRTALTLWIAALLALSAASALASPVRAYALPIWTACAAGLLLIPLVSMLDEEGRDGLERVLRWAAWVLVLLAVYQRLHGAARPPTTFLNQNAFAGAILLLLPLAVRAGDGALAFGLLLCLWWTKSVGAWLGLSVALIAHRRAVGAPAFWFGAVAGFVGLVAAYAKLQSPEWLHRLEWWRAAWLMAADAPWFGLGPGSFAYALSSYAPARPELSSLFAHQHLLESAAERGWPYAALWLAGLALALKPAPAARRFGPVAALAHGLVDYALSVPGVFWLFCASTALALPESARAVNIRSSRRPFLLALLLAVSAGAFVLVSRIWEADRLRATAAASVREGDLAGAESGLAASERLVSHPEAARLRAEIVLVRAGPAPRREDLSAAVAHLERAVALDPYRASNKALLEGARERLRGAP